MSGHTGDEIDAGVSASLIDALISLLSRWDKYESYYMNQLIPRIVGGESLQGSAVADIAAQLRIHLTSAELSQLSPMVASRRAGETLVIQSDAEHRERRRQEQLARKREEERLERERLEREQRQEMVRRREEERQAEASKEAEERERLAKESRDRKQAEKIERTATRAQPGQTPTGHASPSVDRLVRVVAAYRDGLHAHDAEARVHGWLRQLPEGNRVAIADELVHVLERSFMSKSLAAETTRGWLEQPQLVSRGIISAWRDATFIEVQVGGGSQHSLLEIMESEARRMGLGSVRGHRGSKLFVYVDDLAVHGTRILNDLTPWIRDKAPGQFTLLILLQRTLAGREHWVGDQIGIRARDAGKTVRLVWHCESTFHRVDCFWPARLPQDPHVAQYVSSMGCEARLREGEGASSVFSSPQARQLLEDALLSAGVRILACNDRLTPRKYMRPLGDSIWPGLGLGVPIVTWRNCPNSAPLALWAEGAALPLFPRTSNQR